MPFRMIFPRWRVRPRGSSHLGLVFSPGRLAAAVVRLSGQGRPKLIAYESFTDDPSLATVKKWLRQRGLPITSANLLLPGDDYHVLSFETPAVPAAERAEATRWRVKDMVDYPVEEACVDCIVVPAPNGEGEGNHSWAVVAPRARVRDWMQRAKQARIELNSIDIPEMALRNLLVMEPTPNACALLRLSSTGGALIVAWRGELCSFRRFDDLNIAHFETADIIGRQALIERLALEIQRTADAFERQFYGTAIERVWVEQSVPDVDLVQQLAPHVSLRLHAFDLSERLEIDPLAQGRGENRSKNRMSLLAVGAALRNVVAEVAP
jgi:MSHA biogenesis protein MshI